MELLIDPLTDLVSPLATFAMLEASLAAAAIFFGIVALGLWATGRGRLKVVAPWGLVEFVSSRAFRRWHRPFRTFSLLTAGMAVGAPLAVVAIDRFYFSDAVAWLCECASSHGNRLTFQRAEGSLLSGRIILTGATLDRTRGLGCARVIAADKLTIDVAVGPLFFGRRQFDEIAVADAFVQFDAPPSLATSRDKDVRVDRLVIRRARLEAPTESREIATLEITDLSVDGWRGDWPLHDLLFRATTSGGGTGWRFATAAQRTDDGWFGNLTLRGLPVQAVGKRLGGWWSLLTSGEVDVIVSHRRSPSERASIDLQVQLVLRDLKLAIPRETADRTQPWLLAAADYLMEHSQRVSLQFDLLATADAFRDAASASAGDLQLALAESSRRALERRSSAGSALRPLFRDGFDPYEEEDSPVAGLFEETTPIFGPCCFVRP